MAAIASKEVTKTNKRTLFIKISKLSLVSAYEEPPYRRHLEVPIIHTMTQRIRFNRELQGDSGNVVAVGYQ